MFPCAAYDPRFWHLSRRSGRLASDQQASASRIVVSEGASTRVMSVLPGRRTVHPERTKAYLGIRSSAVIHLCGILRCRIGAGLQRTLPLPLILRSGTNARIMLALRTEMPFGLVLHTSENEYSKHASHQTQGQSVGSFLENASETRQRTAGYIMKASQRRFR
jgi:hypothetical protein